MNCNYFLKNTKLTQFTGIHKKSFWKRNQREVSNLRKFDRKENNTSFKLYRQIDLSYIFITNDNENRRF